MLFGCGPAGGATGPSGGGASDLAAPYASLDLGAPSTLPLQQSTIGAGLVEGSEFRAELTAANVEAIGSDAWFHPHWDAGTPENERQIASAGYFIDLNGAPDLQGLLLNWLTPPDADELWVGLADWGEDRWVWRKLESVAAVDLPSPARFRRAEDGFMACALVVVGTNESVLRDLTLHAKPLPDGPRNSGYPLGLNLEPLNDWSRALVYTDIFKLSRDWIPQKAGTTNPWNTGATIHTDADGWVTSLAPGDSVMSILAYDQQGNYPAGRYVCLYDGDGGHNSNAFLVQGNGAIVPGSGSPGRFELDITPTADGTWFKIDKINPADPIRNIRVIMPGFEATYATQNVFHPDFIASLDRFHILRFMDWGRTNNSPVVTWADRTPGTYCRHSAARGAPIEAMVELCNRTNKDLWFCIPHQANDQYVTAAATLIRDTLNPDLRLFLENSNEVWNWSFGQATWSHQRGLHLWPNDSAAWLHYYGLRTAQMMDLAAEVFAGERERLVRVMASQSANPWTGEQCLDQGVTRRSDPAFRHVDVLAVAPYFGNSLGLPENEAATQAMSVSAVLDFCAADSLAKNGPGGETEQNFNNAHARGLPLITYEGGQHLAGVANVENNPVITSLFVAANRHPRMRKIYHDDLALWTARGGTMYVPFAHTGTYGKWGCWGLLERQRQNPASAFKWLGIQDWLTTVLP